MPGFSPVLFLGFSSNIGHVRRCETTSRRRLVVLLATCRDSLCGGERVQHIHPQFARDPDIPISPPPKGKESGDLDCANIRRGRTYEAVLPVGRRAESVFSAVKPI